MNKSKSMGTIAENARLELSKDLVARKNQDGTVIVMKLDDSAVFFKIDGIAASVWTEIGNKPTYSELIATFQGKYPAQGEQVARDIRALVDQLLGKSLIHAVN